MRKIINDLRICIVPGKEMVNFEESESSAFPKMYKLFLLNDSKRDIEYE